LKQDVSIEFERVGRPADGEFSESFEWSYRACAVSFNKAVLPTVAQPLAPLGSASRGSSAERWTGRQPLQVLPSPR
jgi:hypothetical protein